jgi:hypothetical protein
MAFLEFVHNSEREWIIRTDNGKSDSLFSGEVSQPAKVVRQNGNVGSEGSSARVSRRAEEGFYPGRLAQLPGESVFASPAANDQNLHLQDSPFSRSAIAAASQSKAFENAGRLVWRSRAEKDAHEGRVQAVTRFSKQKIELVESSTLIIRIGYIVRWQCSSLVACGTLFG